MNWTKLQNQFCLNKTFNESVIIELFDVAGKNAFRNQFSSIKEKEVISAGYLENGVYQIRIFTQKNIFHSRLVVQN